jgi:membrane protein
MKVKGTPLRRFFGDLRREISDDNVSNGAAALAYYWVLALFPALIVLLSVLPYLPIPNLEQAIMNLLEQVMPDPAATALSSTVEAVVSQRHGKLLSLGLLGTLWAASSGMYAIMQQLNVTYDVKEARPFLKARAMAVVLTLLFGVLVIGAFALVVLGGSVQAWLAGVIGWSSLLFVVFAVVRWVVILFALLLGFALIYYLAPDVEQNFKWISPGSVVGVVLLVAASIGFRIYVDHFGNYGATYGSLGAVIILLLWLYVAGLVMLLGSEVNSLLEHYSRDGKSKGEKRLESPPVRDGRSEHPTT